MQEQIIYQRTGFMAETTQLDQERAQRFLDISDLRRRVIIRDSGLEPEGQTSQVGTDILAWKRIPTIDDLTKITFISKPLHQLTKQKTTYIVEVHDKVIEEKVRKEGYADRDDFEAKSLKLLNRATRSGILQALWNEKMGFEDQMGVYSINFAQIGGALMVAGLVQRFPEIYKEIYLLTCVGSSFFLNALLNSAGSRVINGTSDDFPRLKEKELVIDQGNFTFIHPRIPNRTWESYLLPPFFLLRHLKGSHYLNREGQDLITSRS